MIKSNGKIKICIPSKSTRLVKSTLLGLIFITIVSLLTFDYKSIDLVVSTKDSLSNFISAFVNPALNSINFTKVMQEVLVTLGISAIATIFGVIIAFFGALLCARNISNPITTFIVKGVAAFIRAVPTVLWVLIFAVTAGLGSLSAIIGLSFHSVGYLIKAYAESIEEIDDGTIEALRASGASYWQIVFGAILPSSIRYMVAWTFMRFEINFANAIAVGAVAGAGGIGYSLFMAGNFYFDLAETGFLTWIIVITVIILELISTKIKETIK